MKVGTIETFEEKKRQTRRVGSSSGLGSSGGGNQNNGGGGDGNDGGNNNRGDDYIKETENYPSNKFRIGMWFLLLVVMMTFGGLMSAYIVVSTNGVLEWKPFDLPKAVLVSTFLILASSVTYKMSQDALSADNQTKAKKWLLTTTVLGGMFIASQLLAWLQLVQRGVYMESNPYAGFFYILTAVHALHVIGGIVALGYILLRTWQPTVLDEELVKRRQVSTSIGWYWHFLDGLWIVLVLMLGFWK